MPHSALAVTTSYLVSFLPLFFLQTVSQSSNHSDHRRITSFFYYSSTRTSQLKSNLTKVLTLFEKALYGLPVPSTIILISYHCLPPPSPGWTLAYSCSLNKPGRLPRSHLRFSRCCSLNTEGRSPSSPHILTLNLRPAVFSVRPFPSQVN